MHTDTHTHQNCNTNVFWREILNLFEKRFKKHPMKKRRNRNLMCALNCQNTDWSETERMLHVFEMLFFSFSKFNEHQTHIHSGCGERKCIRKNGQKRGWMKIVNEGEIESSTLAVCECVHQVIISPIPAHGGKFSYTHSHTTQECLFWMEKKLWYAATTTMTMVCPVCQRDISP